MKTKEEIEAMFSKLQLVRIDYDVVMRDAVEVARRNKQALGVLGTIGIYWNHLKDLEDGLKRELCK